MMSIDRSKPRQGPALKSPLVFGVLKRIVRDLLIHTGVTLILAAAIYLKTNDPLLVLVSVAGGIFLDLDHFIDYGLFFRSRFSFQAFMNCLYLKSGKVYLFVHSWELDCLVLVLAVLLKSPVLLVFCLSLSLHLAIDNLQRKNPLFYFFAYRAWKRFDADILLPEIRNEKAKLFLERMSEATGVLDRAGAKERLASDR